MDEPVPARPGRPIRVLHVIKTLGLGGAETNLLNLADAFDPRVVETHVAYSFGGEIEERFRSAGLRLFKYAVGNHKVKSLHTFLIVARLAAYVRRHRIDIVQTHNFNGHVWGLLAARLGGAKVIEHVHDFRYTPTDELVRRHGLEDQYRFARHFKHRSDRVVVLTRANREFVIANGISTPERAVEMQNGIPLRTDAIARPDLRASLGIPADAIVVLTSARMEPAKNIDLVLRIAQRVVDRVPRALFLVAGSGRCLDEYRTRCASQGLGATVRFIGFHRDIEGLLSVADVYLLPSFLELHSIAILEAMKARVPIVVSRNVGCHDEFIVDGVDGFLCDPFEEDGWIDAIVRLAGDPALRSRVGQAGHDTCERLFDMPGAARRFERLYSELAQS